MKNKSGWMVLAVIMGLSLLCDLNKELFENICLVLTFVFVAFLLAYHYLSEKGKL